MANQKTKKKKKILKDDADKPLLMREFNISDEKIKDIFGLAGVILGVIVGIFLILGLFTDVLKAVKSPTIEVENATLSEDGSYNLELREGNSLTLCIKPDLAAINKAKLSILVNGKSVETMNAERYKDCWKIPNKSIKIGQTYRILASNKAGEAAMLLRISKQQTKQSSDDENDDWQIAAHLACKHYAQNYFYPYNVKFHDILGVKYDAILGDSWVYNLSITVSSSRGGETKYDMDCKVNKSGSVTMFEALLE